MRCDEGPSGNRRVKTGCYGSVQTWRGVGRALTALASQEHFIHLACVSVGRQREVDGIIKRMKMPHGGHAQTSRLLISHLELLRKLYGEGKFPIA